MKKLLCSLLCFVHFSLLAQETISIKVPNHGYPKLPTLTPEQEKKLISQSQANPPKALTSSIYGGLSSGTMPVAPPEVSSINRFKDVPVNLFTGSAIIPVPLYTLEEAGISVPISLNYNASGMKTHEVAGWTGIGWNLVSGGMITREVKGLPDEGKLDLKPNSWTSSNHRKGYYSHGFNYYTSSVDDDTEPDIFYMNINGQSYKFMYKYSGVPRFIFLPDNDIKIIPTFQFLPESNVVGQFTKFEVLMPDGTKYIFGNGYTETSTEVEVKTAQQLDIYPTHAHFEHYWKNEAITSAWYLTRIETPYGASIDFEYHRVTYSFFKVAENESLASCPAPEDVTKSLTRVYVWGSTLSSIKSEHKKVEFNKRYNNCEITNFGVTCSGSRRLDLDGWTTSANPINATLAKKMSEMTVMDNVPNPTDTLIYTFDHGYFTQSDGLPAGYTNADVGYTHTRRLRLDKITFPDASTYRFRYRSDEPDSYSKSRLDYGIDHWGYSNGYSTNNVLTGLIGPDAFFKQCSVNTSVRETNPDFNFAGNLDSIIVSTGTRIKLDYELHRARNYKDGNIYKPIGGCRIKEVRTKDVISNIEIIKKYSYLMPDSSRTSGFLCLQPIYRFRNEYGLSGSNSGLYSRLLAESSRVPVGYSHVTEQILDNNGNQLGRTEYTFDQDTTELTIQRHSIHCTGDFPNQVCDTTTYYEPEKAHTNMPDNMFQPSYGGGNLLQKTVFNQKNDTLSIQSYKYNDLFSIENTLDNTRAARVFKTNGYNLGYDSYSKHFSETFYLLFRRYNLDSETTTIFSQNGTNPVSNTTNYYYKYASGAYKTKYPNEYSFPYKTNTRDGQGHLIENLNKYVADFNFGLDTTLIERTCYDEEFGFSYACDTTVYTIHVPRIGSQMRAIYELQQKNILTPIVESSNTNNGYLLDAYYLRYDKINTASTGFKYYLRESFTLDGVGTILQGVQYDRLNNDTTYIDSDYRSMIEYQDYNTKGLLKKSKPFGGVVSGTDYESSFDIMPIRSIQNIGGIVIDTTTYEYDKKIFGLSKKISPNGLSLNYSFYTQSENNKTGQLKQITDRDGNILTHYEYPYKGQTLLGTAGSFSTDTTKNRIIARVPRIATNNPYQDFEKVTTSVNYSDGSGRELQSRSYKQSPNTKDLVYSTPQYDTFGRNHKTILPIASDIGNGQYQNNIQNQAQTFYGDTAPYSEITQFEQSPLSRPFKSIGAGAAFRPTKENQQQFETGNFGLMKYEVFEDGAFLVETYTGNQIFKTTRIDEQQRRVISFTDKSGKTLEEHVQFTGDGSQTGDYLKTTYIYDYLGRLAVILPPKLYGLLVNTTHLAISPYLAGFYQFKYDSQSRVVEKHIPDAGWEYMVYNRLGQLVMSQNARLRTENKWQYKKYDAFGRVYAVGVVTNTNTRATIQNSFDAYTESKQYEERIALFAYTNRSFPAGIAVADSNAMIINYYDDYTWKANDTLNFTQYKTPQYTNAKGLLTGTSVRRFDTKEWLRTAFYYDDKNRLIQSQSENRFGTVNQTDQVYDFIGQLLEERTIYRKPASDTIVSRTAYSYDHAGRKTQAIHFLNGRQVAGQSPQLLATYEYDELGRLKAKNLNETKTDSIIRQNENLTKGKTDVARKYILILPNTNINLDSTYLAFIGSGLQQVTYQYNIRGNLNCINCTSTGLLDANKVFALKLDYFEDNRYYNGNLSRQSWKTSKDTTTRRFLYDYDAANRFINADFVGKGNEKYSTNTSYDANGNILTLNRKGLLSTNSWGDIDSLTYTYPNYQNRLTGILDKANATVGFVDNGTSNDYTYYADGSLKTDANKGITNIVYNYLGLPERIEFGPIQRIENVYAADGQKLFQKIINGSNVIRTDYIGDLVYKNDTLISILHDEGKIRFDSLGLAHYQYFITDHLGNTRVIFERLNDSVYLAQENHYGAWGEVLQGIGNKGDWNFLFQGKEYVDAFGYNSYDFHARQYDPFAGRFNSTDPKNQFSSGYVGMGNMPTIGVDPDGEWLHIAIGAVVGGTINLVTHWNKAQGFKQKLLAFGIGAAAGAVTAATGGAAVGAFGLGATTFAGGAVTGAIGAAAGGPIQGIGNMLAFGDSYTVKDFGLGVLGGAVIGGATGSFLGRHPKLAAKIGNWYDKTEKGIERMFGIKPKTSFQLDPLIQGETELPDGEITQSFGGRTAGQTLGNNSNNLDGSFSITDWSSYPTIGNVPKPTGPFRILENPEYATARNLANRTNELLKKQGIFPRGVDIHEIHPVKFGGSPTDIANKIALPRPTHTHYTNWWNRLQKDITKIR
ncbi:RHS repeat domain-containing protein [Emticicia soli]|uniref:DUF6443 domain-containing protein n=1 Tax=Emticicia soli TaxID=2027878 RepID=A0ABW5J487_9BACT